MGKKKVTNKKKDEVKDEVEKSKRALQPKKETKQQVKMTAILTDEKGNETLLEREDGPPIIVVEQMSNIGMSRGQTVNTGDYNNKKVQVSLHIPCYVNEINKVYKAISKKTSEWMEELIQEIEEDI